MAEKQYTNDDIWNLIEGENVCMFANLDDSVIRSRPMAPMVRQDDGLIWFVTDRTSGKMQDLGDDTPVTLTFQNSASNWYVSLAGSVSVFDDKARLNELWNPMMKQWFDGPDDPRMVLLAFEPYEADYWNGPNRLTAGLKMLVTATTGVRTDMGDTGKVVM